MPGKKTKRSKGKRSTSVRTRTVDTSAATRADLKVAKEELQAQIRALRAEVRQLRKYRAILLDELKRQRARDAREASHVAAVEGGR